MKRIIFAFVIFAGCFFGVCSSAFATTCSVPNTFTNGTIASAPQVNANFSALVSCGNTIDNTNIGTLGIYATQIIPTTLAQAVFGGAFGYTFNNGLFFPLVASPPTAGANQMWVGVDSSGYGDFRNQNGNGFRFQNADGTSTYLTLANGVATLNASGANTINSNTTGTAAAFVMNNNNATPTTGDLLDLQKGGTNKVQFTNAGGIVALDKGSFVGGADGGGGVNIGTANTYTSDAFHVGSAGCSADQRVAIGNSGTNGVGGINGQALLIYCNGFRFALDGSGDAAMTGTFEAAKSNGSTITYVPPVYTSSGAAVASTLHGVQFTATLGSGGVSVVCGSGFCTVSGLPALSGAAAFSSASSYNCSGNDVTDGYMFGAKPSSGTAFTLVDFIGTGNAPTTTASFYITCWGT